MEPFQDNEPTNNTNNNNNDSSSTQDEAMLSSTKTKNEVDNDLREPLQEERIAPGSPVGSPKLPAAFGNPEDPPPSFPPEVLNPMVSNTSAHSTVLQRIKMTILALTLLPLRIILLIITVLLGWGMAKIALCCVSQEDLDTVPLHEGPFKRMTYAMARICMFLMGYHWIRTKDEDYARHPDGTIKRANIVVVNHSTVADGFLLYYLHGLMSIGVKAIADAPIIGTFAAVGQAMSLDRDNADCRKKIGDEMQRRVTWSEEAEREHGQWQPLVVFAEGTCTNQKALIQFRHGAFAPGVPVQPLCVKYPWSYCDQSWCGISSAMWVKLRLLCQFHNSLHIEYLPVYVPSEEEKQDPKLYAENVQKKMAEALGIPVTDHTFEDMSLQAAAKRLRLPWRLIHAEMGYFRRHGSTSERAKIILKRFAEVNTSKSGELSVEELLTAMNLKNYPHLGPAVTSVFNNRFIPNVVSFRHFYFVLGLRKIRQQQQQQSQAFGAKPAYRAFWYDVASEEDKSLTHQLLFAEAVSNGDDKLSKDDFVSFMRKGLRDESELVTAEIEKWFDDWDEHKRGFLLPEQFKKGLSTVYPFLAEVLVMSIGL